MRGDVAQRERTRARVLKAAAKAIRKDGPHRVGVAGVMAKAGLTHGGFYFHFASRDELIVAAIAQMFDEGRARFARATGRKAPAEAIRAYVDFYLSPTHRDQRDTGCVLSALSVDMPRLSPKARACFSDGVQRMQQAVASLLAAAGIDDADAVASSVLAELVGALTLSRAVFDRAQSDAILAQSRAHVLTRLGLA